MNRGKPLKRTKGVRPEQRRFLIYCEGACTEDQYFKGLRTDLRSLPVAICLGGEHGEPKSLVRAAIDHQKRAPHSAGDRWTEYDEVWCVIDVEAPVPHEGLTAALKLARQHGVEVALSNPCFELWLLLHFKDMSGYCTSAAAQRALERLDTCGYSVDRKVCAPDMGRPSSARRCCGSGRRRGMRTNPGRTSTGWSGC
ncbi:RloB family protein [Streptomyces sp. NBC_00053]|uniref:RloB family protein n=1 Tax=unclassified Streptomyces TaxID=2593676 RepID=UPI001F14A75E|nr:MULTISPECIES: RloB family protein [unclassified Streptomyces]MCX5502228.1 RloB family protein [Streptomyces sp. NBC_00052]MCX5549236.1 RloB family protein [Streptomyces sp. NBC_00051]WSC28588.1 RloB family protein [Streptomyces sp. NBC_01768]WSG52478.1 RloB family protein [Streptomyces sp. NBC_01732]